MARNPDVYWLALRNVPGVGPRTAKMLLEEFGTAERIFQLSETELIAAGVYRNAARNMVAFADYDRLERELCELPRVGASLLRWSDPEYPLILRQIADPPPFLYVRGSFDAQQRNCVAIVGARAASDAGRHMARRLAMELAARGIAVVSGLARGIDSEAHQGALDGTGITVAVMGCGIDVIYPAENRKLAESIIDKGGALLSELPIGTPPMAENFPTRNRILSGLCLGVVIVEAAEKSGSLITARMALEQDRQVFAVPGSPLFGKSRGSNRLLKEGAKLVECVEDVIEELAPQLGANPVSNEARNASAERSRRAAEVPSVGAAEPVETLLGYLKEDEKVHVDSIVESSGLTPQTVLGLLLELELQGIVTQYPGKLFSLAAI